MTLGTSRDKMEIANNKVELLRALERTVDQFNTLIERNCKGELQDPVTVVTSRPGGAGGGAGSVTTSVQPTVQGQTFSKEDKEFLEEFKQIYQLGIFQLNNFIKKLMTLSQLLDPYTIQYYIRQLYNGPYAKFVKAFARFQGIFQRITDCLGIISAVSRSNSSTPVFSGVAAVVSVGVLNKSPSFIQRELNSIARTTAEVFNYNFQSSIFDDNTLPYIDKRPLKRVADEVEAFANELHRGLTSNVRAISNYMLKDIKTFNIFANKVTGIARRILDLIKLFLGADAFRLFEFNKNINPFDPQQNVSITSNSSIPRLLVFTDQVVSETGNAELKERCVELQTNVTGSVVVNNIMTGSLDGSDLYTVEGRLGSKGGGPVDGSTLKPPTTTTPPQPEVPGCMDPKATNYNPNATVDDESCEYPTEEEIVCPVECDDTTLDY